MHPDAPARRITTWLAILGYTLVASGLPLPLGGVGVPAARDTATTKRLAAKDRSRPFPCMDKPCGCDTALERRAAVAVAVPREEGSCCAAEPSAKPAGTSCCATTTVDRSAPEVRSTERTFATNSAAAARLPERCETNDADDPRRSKTLSLGSSPAGRRR